jgi:hypothetical protein
MGLYTGTVKGLHLAPYRDQVLVHLIGWSLGDKLSEAEEAKIARVQRFLDAYQCAEEIRSARERARSFA